ncbi:MAG: hypothetical protein WD751_11930 [Anaerolineales bacterium]
MVVLKDKAAVGDHRCFAKLKVRKTYLFLFFVAFFLVAFFFAFFAFFLAAIFLLPRISRQKNFLANDSQSIVENLYKCCIKTCAILFEFLHAQ